MKYFKLCILLAYAPIVLQGQLLNQVFTLEPGWNSIYLEVDPVPKECAAIFENLPVQSVWAWAKQFETTAESGLDWLIYHPGQPGLTDLHQLQGGKSYLVQISGEEAVELNLKGKPVLPRLSWQSDTFNLAGFHVDKENAPTFSDYFASAPELVGNEVLMMDSEGDWTPIQDLEQNRIEKGVSYWVKCDRFTTFNAPLELELEQDNCLIFGTSIVEQPIRLRNYSTSAKQVNLTPYPAELVAGNLGEVALIRKEPSGTAWETFDDVWQVEIEPNSVVELTIGVDRTQLQNGSDGTYQSLIEVKDDEGTQLFVPVSASLPTDRAGLWVGYANLDAVNYVNGLDDSPQPAASAFQLRLILHVDADGNARLLDQVTQMWKEGTYKEDPEDPNQMIVDEPGTFVLLTDDALVSQYAGAALRDGKPVGRRLSTPFFSFDTPPLLSGGFEEELSVDSLVISYDDPLNPFKHQYHPDHNNLDERFEEPLPEGLESYTVTRSLRLQFTEEDPENLNLPGWGDNQVGGLYSETIAGIHRQALKVSGSFRLQRISTINRLDEPPTPNAIFPEEGIATPQSALRFFEHPLIDTDLTIFPNPVDQKLFIKGLPEGIYQVKISDINGKLVSRLFLSSGNQINTKALQAGTYFLQVSDGFSSQTIQFIKISN